MRPHDGAGDAGATEPGAELAAQEAAPNDETAMPA